MLETPKTPADVRALIAYHDLKLYHLGPQVGLHPSKLSLILHGKAPLYPDLLDRLCRAIQESTDTK